eukprot:jgi/Galph1/926/GphlegSOOS_G5718.1
MESETSTKCEKYPRRCRSLPQSSNLLTKRQLPLEETNSLSYCDDSRVATFPDTYQCKYTAVRVKNILSNQRELEPPHSATTMHFIESFSKEAYHCGNCGRRMYEPIKNTLEGDGLSFCSLDCYSSNKLKNDDLLSV